MNRLLSAQQISAPGARVSQVIGDLQPRYAALAGVLAADIMDGRRSVGEMLPTEGELCATFGVSRSTVREALRRLREHGLVEAFRGVGTRVIADAPRSDYVMAARSVAEVMGYAAPTRLDITARDTVRANKALAARLGCEPGSAWCHVAGIRRAERPEAAISCVDLYIAAEFADVAADPALVTTPAYRLIGQRLGIAVAEIRQEITAIALSKAQAAVLGSRGGRPGLHIRRRFYAADGRLMEATLNVHPAADRFAYALRLGEPVA
jgi:GntR family transcriptional regulator